MKQLLKVLLIVLLPAQALSEDVKTFGNFVATTTYSSGSKMCFMAEKKRAFGAKEALGVAIMPDLNMIYINTGLASTLSLNKDLFAIVDGVAYDDAFEFIKAAKKGRRGSVTIKNKTINHTIQVSFIGFAAAYNEISSNCQKNI